MMFKDTLIPASRGHEANAAKVQPVDRDAVTIMADPRSRKPHDRGRKPLEIVSAPIVHRRRARRIGDRLACLLVP